MAKPTAMLFIDGSNFYHAVKEDRHGVPLDEKEFSALFKQISDKFQLQEIRFYDALKDRTKEPDNYAKQQRFHEKLKLLVPKLSIHTRALRYVANITPERLDAVAKQTGIIDRCKNLLWPLLVNLKLVRLTKEKGIDVLLVVQAIQAAREKKPDWILLLSGDADFTPAVQLIRSLQVKTLNLHAYAGSSNELRAACDTHALISFSTGSLQIQWNE